MPTGDSSKSKEIEFIKESRLGTAEKTGDIRKIIKKWLEYTERGIARTQDSKRGEYFKSKIKSFFHSKLIPTHETFPIKEYIEFKNTSLRNQGYELIDSVSEETVEEVIRNQKKSLDTWIDYFTSEESSSTPIWAKYWAFLGIIKMGVQSISEKDGVRRFTYNKREKITFNSFPELNREALAKAVDFIIAKV
jgi:hypothetical protein